MVKGFKGDFIGFGNVLSFKCVCEHNGSSLLLCFALNM